MHLDLETYSDLDLSEVGLQRYARHPSTRVIMATIRDGNGVYHTYDKRDPDAFEENGITYSELCEAIVNADEIHAWNAPFEYAICEHTMLLPVKLEDFYCTMAHALYRSLPADLDECAAVIGIRGKVDYASRLISTFCKPSKNKEKPEDWASFRAYNIHDVEMEHAAATVLREQQLPWPRTEREIWLANERLNLQGVPIDPKRAEMAWWLFGELCSVALARIQQITGVKNPNAPKQLIEWLRTRGTRTPSLDKDHVKKLLELDLPDDVREVLILRRCTAMMAPKKFEVALRQHWEGRMCNMVQYSGAGRTHRFAGRGLQPHNMRRGPDNDATIAEAWGLIEQAFNARDPEFFAAMYKEPFTVLADCIRSMIRDPSGDPIVVADYASIEVVVLWWVAGAERLMQMFREGKDPYKMFAVTLFGVLYEEVTKKMRTDAKPPVLGGGYGLGKDTLVEYAENMGIKLTIEEAERAVIAYRRDHPEITAAWSGLGSAMRETLRTGQPHKFGHVTFIKRGEHVLCKLPSGAEITYWKARIEKDFWPDGNEKAGGVLVYDGVNQYTHQWGRITTWGGKLIENIVQSIARDVLVHGLLRALQAGVPVFLHVHDEIVTQVRNSVAETKEALQKAMTPPPWITTCPVQAHPFVCTDGYRKD